MIVVKADKPVFNTTPIRREGEWVTYDMQDHKRHVVTRDTVTTLDNKEVHHAKRTSSGTTTST
jgi:hypothetical protein